MSHYTEIARIIKVLNCGAVRENSDRMWTTVALNMDCYKNFSEIEVTICLGTDGLLEVKKFYGYFSILC